MKKATKRKVVIGTGILIVLSVSILALNFLGVIQLMSISGRAGSLGWGDATLDISSNCRQEWTVVNGKPYKYICDLSDKKYGSVAVLSGTNTAIGSGGEYYVQDFSQRGDFVTFKTGIVTLAAPNGVWVYYGARWKLNPLPFTWDKRSGGHILNLVPEINGLQYETAGNDNYADGTPFVVTFPPIATADSSLKRLDGTRVTQGPKIYDPDGSLAGWVSYSTELSGGSCCARFDRIGKDIIFTLNGGDGASMHNEIIYPLQGLPYSVPTYRSPGRRSVWIWNATVAASMALPTSDPFVIRNIFQLPADQQRTSDLQAQDQSVTSCPANIQCATNPSTSYTSVHVQTDDFYMDGVTESTSCYAGNWLGMVPCSMLFTGFIRFNDFDGMPAVIPPEVPNSATLYLSAPPVDVNFAIANPYSHLTGLYWPTYYKGDPATLAGIIETIRLKQLSPEELQFEKGMWAGTRVTTWTTDMEQMFGVSSGWLRLHIQVGGSVPANERAWNQTFGGTYKEFLTKPKVQIGCLVYDETSAKSWVQHPSGCLSDNQVFIDKFTTWSSALYDKTRSYKSIYYEWIELGFRPGAEPFGFDKQVIVIVVNNTMDKLNEGTLVINVSKGAMEHNTTIGTQREGELIYKRTVPHEDDGLWGRVIGFLMGLWSKLRG